MANKISKKESKTQKSIVEQDISNLTKLVKKGNKNLIQSLKFNYKKNKELLIIIAFMAFLFLAILGTAAFVKSLNHFNYKGLSFTKERFGQIEVFHYYYYFDKDGQQYQYNLFLRIDPRKNNVSMSGETEYPEGKIVYVGVNGTGITQCPTASRDLGTLGSFFTNNLLKLKAGVLDKIEANNTNSTYISCNDHPDSAVIKIFSGNETLISKDGNCYNIQIANCETTSAIEKFETNSILDAKARSLQEKAKSS